MITKEDIISRIARKIAAAQNMGVTPWTIRQILKYEHLALHLLMPSLLREHLTGFTDAIAISDLGNGYMGTIGTASVTIEGTAYKPKEINSVVNSTMAAGYKKADSLEHISNIELYGEDTVYGRFWFPVRGNGKLMIYRGSEVQPMSSDTSLILGVTRELDTSYADIGDDLSGEFDSPTEAVSFLVAQTASKCLEDRRAQIPEWLGQEITDQSAKLLSADQAYQQNLIAMERQGKDIRPQ